MDREFIYINNFIKKWKDCELPDSELQALEIYLLENPVAGDVMQGTGGLRKLRWALPKGGKSGGIRVLYIDIVIAEKIYMIDLFTKNEKDNLSDSEKSEVKKLVKTLIDEEMKKQ